MRIVTASVALTLALVLAPWHPWLAVVLVFVCIEAMPVSKEG